MRFEDEGEGRVSGVRRGGNLRNDSLWGKWGNKLMGPARRIDAAISDIRVPV